MTDADAATGAEGASRPARRGLILMLSSPSGAGKSTLARTLLGSDKAITLSVSVTTRARRGSEIDGVHYHFVSPRRFASMRESDELLEWAEVHGHFYGTPREPVETALCEGRDILFDIDWQGAQQVRGKAGDDVVSIFVLPPSFAELKARLIRRAEDKPEVIARRLKNALIEMEHWHEYDYVIINDDLDVSFSSLQSILAAERQKRSRRPELDAFMDGLFVEAKALLSGQGG